MEKEMSIREIQLNILNILIVFNEFCTNNHLRYYLAGGTLLGAIRHKGFIPWDNDIDVCMPRKDYNMFIKIFPQLLKERFKLNCLERENLLLPFAKLFDTYTRILSTNKYIDEDRNAPYLWIDIFPVDGLPEDMEVVEKIYKRENFYRRILVISLARLGEGKNFFRKTAKFFLKPIINMLGVEKILKGMDILARKYDYQNMKYVGIVSWGLYGVGERMLKSEFERAVDVEFEGHKFPAFSCWDTYLHGLYGDYMQLPPLGKRKIHDLKAYIVDN
jgi:lipopolysaccharide cholinephosphotransferase